MELYKHNEYSFTLINHERIIYEIIIMKKNDKPIANKLGTVGSNYIANGQLLYKIPNLLKSLCYNLNIKK